MPAFIWLSSTLTLPCSSMSSMGTWHPHIYDSQPKKPTPYFVATILGLDSSHMPAFVTKSFKSKQTQRDSNGTESEGVKMETHETTSSVKKSNSQSKLSGDNIGR